MGGGNADEDDELVLLVSIEEEISAAAEKLDAEEQCAIAVFAQENEDLLKQLHTKHLANTTCKFNIDCDMRASVTTTALSGALDHSKAEVAQMTEIVKKHFGEDDWKNCKAVQELTTRAGNECESLEGVFKDTSAKISKRAADVAEEKDIEKVTACLAAMGKDKQEAMAQLLSVKKTVVGIRNAVKRKEKDETKGLQPVDAKDGKRGCSPTPFRHLGQ